MPPRTLDELMESLSGRVRAFVERDDPSGVLSPEAAAEADTLWPLSVDTLRDGEQDAHLAAVRLLAEVYWLRGQLTRTDAEIHRALQYWILLYGARRDVVPAEIRDLIVSGLEIEPGLRVRIAAGLIDQADESALEEAIELLRRASTECADDAQLRGGALTFLGLALYIRFERSREPHGLDDAIDANRAAVAALPDASPDRDMAYGNLTATLAARFALSHDPADLDEAIAAGRDATETTDPKTRAGALANLAVGLYQRHQAGRDRADLDEAIELARSAVDNAPRHPEVGGHLSNLGSFLLTRFKLMENSTDLDDAIEAHRRAVEVTSPEHFEWYKYRAVAAEAFAIRAQRTASRTDLDTAGEYLSSVVDRIPDGHPDSRLVGRVREIVVAVGDRLEEQIGAYVSSPLHEMSSRAEEAYQRSLETGDAAALANAITLLRHVADALPDGHPVKTQPLTSLAAALYSQYQRTGSRESLDEGLQRIQAALQGTPRGHQARGSRLNLLAAGLQYRYQEDHAVSDLDQAITTQRAALEEETDPTQRPPLLSNLAGLLRLRSEEHGREEDLDEAIAYARSAIASTPEGDPGQATRLDGLAALLFDRDQRAGGSGRPDDLAEIIELCEAAVTAMPGDHPHRHQILGRLAMVLRTRFERTDRLEDLETAVSLYRDALAAVPPGHPERPDQLYTLASALGRRFETTGDRDDIHAAVGYACEAVETVETAEAIETAGSAEVGRDAAVGLLARLVALGAGTDTLLALRAGFLLAMHARADDPDGPGAPDPLSPAVGLAMTLLDEYKKTGRAATLDEALARLRQALRTAPDDDSRSARACRSIMAFVLLNRFATSGDRADLDEAVDLVPEDDDDPQRLAVRGTALSYRYRYGGPPDDQDNAIATLRTALSLEGDTPSSAMLNNLCGSLRERFEDRGDPADLDEAVTHGRAALAAAPDDPVVLSNLGGALRGQAEFSHDGALLDEAIGVLTRAAELTDRPDLRYNLGAALSVRHDHTKDAADLDAALGNWQEAANRPDGSPVIRLRSARAWGEAAAAASRVESAAQAYETAVGLVPVVVWRGMSRSAQELRLTDLRWLAADAAASQLLADRPDSAVELLEQGRTVLWSQAVQARSSLSELRATAPELAARLNEVRHALETETNDAAQ